MFFQNLIVFFILGSLFLYFAIRVYRFIKPKKSTNNKIVIHTSSAELPNPVEIDLTPTQLKALWVALEFPYRKHLNKTDINSLYNIEVKYD